MDERDPLIGSAIAGVYQITEAIAAGGMGTVYKAKDLRLKRTVAVKIMKPVGQQQTSMLRRFAREAEVTASLSHANIVRVYDAGKHGELPYFVMEYVAHPTLARLIANHPNGLSFERARKITVGICRALEHAHAAGLVHRDLKPANVFVAPDDHAVVADFGLVHVEAGTKLTKTGAYVGTPLYLSPEAVTGAKTTGRSDLYQVGLLLYEMLAGERPFPSGYIHGLLDDGLPDGYQRLVQRREDLPSWIDPIIERCLAVNPADRYGSARNLMEDLDVRSVTKTVSKLSRPRQCEHGAPAKRTLVGGSQSDRGGSQKGNSAVPSLSADGGGRRNKVPLIVAVLALCCGAFLLRSWFMPPTLQIEDIRVEAGVEGLKVHLRSSRPCTAVVLCRPAQQKALVAEGRQSRLAHQLVFNGLRADVDHQLQVILTDGEVDTLTVKSELLQARPLPAPRPAIAVDLQGAKLQARIGLDDRWQYRARVTFPRGADMPLACEARDEAVIGRAIGIPRDRALSLEIAAERDDWERYALPSLVIPSPAAFEGAAPVGVSLWSLLCRPDLFEKTIALSRFEQLRACGLRRICFPWRPTAAVDKLATNVARAQGAGFAVEVVLFVNKLPREGQHFFSLLDSLVRQCGDGVERYYVSAFIDGMGWYSSTEAYVTFFTELRRAITGVLPKTRAVAGSLGMLTDTTFLEALLQKAPQVFDAGAAMAFSPCLTSADWSVIQRTRRYRGIFDRFQRRQATWTVFLGMPCKEAPFYDTPLSSLVIGERSIANLGNPDLLLLPPNERKALSEKERDTMIRFFASSVHDSDRAATELVASTVRGASHGVERTYWVLSPTDCAKLFDRTTDATADFLFSSAARLSPLLQGATVVARSGSGDALAGYGLAITEGSAEYYVFETERGRVAFLWPQKHGGQIRVKVERMGTYVPTVHPALRDWVYRFRPLEDGKTSFNSNGPVAVLPALP